MARDKKIYEERYKAGVIFKKEVLPILRHVPGFRIDSMELKAAGVIDRNGKRLEYQDVRMYLREEP